MSDPIELTAGTVTEVVYLSPYRPHTEPDERGCPDCDQPAYSSGCDAEGCSGWGCQDCGTGCDLDFLSADEGGRCDQAADDQDED